MIENTNNFNQKYLWKLSTIIYYIKKNCYVDILRRRMTVVNNSAKSRKPEESPKSQVIVFKSLTREVLCVADHESGLNTVKITDPIRWTRFLNCT